MSLLASKPAGQSLLKTAGQQAAYLAIRTGIGAISVWPPEYVLDAAGSLARVYATMNAKRLTRATANLGVAFPDWDEARRRQTAIGAHEHLFKFGVEFAYAPRLLTEDSWPDHLELGDLGPAIRGLISGRPCILITGHCGNWELLAYALALMGFPMHALYRPLDLPPMNRWLLQTRGRRGLTLVDKFGALKQLPKLVEGGAPIGFVADQNGGDRGLFVPFFNRLASTYKSIGLLALQFNATVVCGCARRLPSARPGLLGYKIELADSFGPEDWAGQPDPLYYITARYRRAIETMVRRAPEQYLWMHRIWRSRPLHERSQKPFPKYLEHWIRSLPWITEADVGQIKEHSARDARTLAETGETRLS